MKTLLRIAGISFSEALAEEALLNEPAMTLRLHIQSQWREVADLEP